MAIQLDPSGTLARITAIDNDDDRRVYIDFRDGKTGSFVGIEHDYVVGDVLLVTENTENHQMNIRRVPRSTWPDALWVGVVKIKLPDITVVNSSTRFRIVPTVNMPEYKEGNTVLAGDVQGVTRVLSKSPIKYIDLPEIDDTTIARFRSERPKESDLSFADFGGLPEVVARARELIEVPLREKGPLGSDRRTSYQRRAVHRRTGHREDNVGANNRRSV